MTAQEAHERLQLLEETASLLFEADRPERPNDPDQAYRAPATA